MSGEAVPECSFGGVDYRDSGGCRQYVWPAAHELIQSIEQSRGSVDGASARPALRSCPIVIAALSPWPATSPTRSRIRPRGSSTASYQSPPMPLRVSAGPRAPAQARHCQAARRGGGDRAHADADSVVVARVVETLWTGRVTRDVMRHRNAESSADAGLDRRDESVWTRAG
jgi:hypothetical protein